MLRTPLAASHEALGARMTDFNGWYLPIQYEGIIAEHHRTRMHCSVFDTCHMGRFELKGPDALANLGRLLTTDTTSMVDGQCRYGFLLNDAAGIIDDLVAYRFSAARWLIVVNAGTRVNDLAWMQQHIKGNAVLTDLTHRLAKVDVQGPASPSLVSAVLRHDLTALPRFRHVTFELSGKPVVVSRTGYTGESGYEVYVDAAESVALWDALVKAGAVPAGLGARDTLRLEAALPLYGHELSVNVSPAEAGLMRFVTNPCDYIGRAALDARRAAGPLRFLAGFRMPDRRTGRSGDRVSCAGRDAGVVTSGSFSPTLGCGIGMAYIDSALTKAGQSINVLTSRGALDAAVAATPFYLPTAGQRERKTT
jgi:aminomethyltransferase